MKLQLHIADTQLFQNRICLNSALDIRSPRFDAQCPIADSQSDKVEPVDISRHSHNTQPPAFLPDPYVGLSVIGTGMTEIVFQLGENRVAKKAKQYQSQPLKDRDYTGYIYRIKPAILESEIRAFECLGSYEGIISCLKTSHYGIELALAQGDLKS